MLFTSEQYYGFCSWGLITDLERRIGTDYVKYSVSRQKMRILPHFNLYLPVSSLHSLTPPPLAKKLSWLCKPQFGLKIRWVVLSPGPSPGGERREVPQCYQSRFDNLFGVFLVYWYFDQLVYNLEEGEFLYKKDEKKLRAPGENRSHDRPISS